MNFPSEKDDWKNFVKNNVAIALNILYVRKKKHILLMFQNTIQIMENTHAFNDSKWRKTQR